MNMIGESVNLVRPYASLLSLLAVPLLAWLAFRQFSLGLLRLRLRNPMAWGHEWYIMVTQSARLQEQFRLRHWTRKRNGQIFYQWTTRREVNPFRRLWNWLLGIPPKLELETDDEGLLSFAVSEEELPLPPLTVRELMNSQGYIFNGEGELVPLKEETWVSL